MDWSNSVKLKSMIYKIKPEGRKAEFKDGKIVWASKKKTPIKDSGKKNKAMALYLGYYYEPTKESGLKRGWYRHDPNLLPNFLFGNAKINPYICRSHNELGFDMWFDDLSNVINKLYLSTNNPFRKLRITWYITVFIRTGDFGKLYNRVYNLLPAKYKQL